MKDIHIEVLKFGRENPGFELDEFKERFPDDFDWIQREIIHSKLFQTTDKNPPYKYHLSFSDRSKLLEWEELHDARKSSKQAMIIAIISIILTLAALAYQIFNTPKVEIINLLTTTEQQSFGKKIQSPLKDIVADTTK